MGRSAEYFTLGRNAEKSGNLPSALLYYISSFNASYNDDPDASPYAVTEKISRIRAALGIDLRDLLFMSHSYGVLTDNQCRHLLYYSLLGQSAAINAILVR